MAVYGYVGLCRAVYGYVRLCRAVYGYPLVFFFLREFFLPGSTI